MEKLKPILKQRYWVCFGLALLFVIIGWWSASGDLATQTEIRKKSVADSFNSADQGKTDPNAKWVEGGKTENDLDSAAYKTASLQLWKRQQAAREWPEQIRSEMQKMSYFSDIKSKETRERWVSIYQKQIVELLQIVKPFKHETGDGLVLVDANRITRQPFNKWQIDYPSSNEIWSNQEDIWLLKALLTSISKTNDSATRITESQVPEIKQLTLRGGDRKTKPAGKSGGADGGGGMGGGGMGGGGMGGGGMGGGGMGGGGMGGGGMGGGGMGGGGAASHSHPGTTFEGVSVGDVLTEEFGAVAGAGGGGFGGGGQSSSGSMPSKMSGAGSMGDGKGAATTKEVRYVDDAAKDQGYKTRAFLLDVVIRDERLPDLLAKLTNSDFPVEIVRVEMLSRAGGGMGGGGMGGGGMGGGGMPGGGGMGSGGMGSGGPRMSLGDPQGGLSGGGMGMRGSSSRFGGMPSDGGAAGADGPGMMDDGVEAARGVELMSAAMADPLLIEVRIGGLLTLYMTPEETETQAKTEETSAKEEQAEKTTPPSTESRPSETKTGVELIAPETSGAQNLRPEVQQPVPVEGTILPNPAVPDASLVEPDAERDVSGQSKPSQGTELKPVSDGSPAVPAGTSPLVPPSP